MEIAMAATILLLTIIGFNPPQGVDGWTTYRDRAILVGLIPVFVWMYVGYPAFAIVFTLLSLRFKSYRETEKIEFWRGVHIWAFVFIVWLLLQNVRMEYLPLLMMALVMAGTCQAVFAIVDEVVFYSARLRGKKAIGIIGSLGNRTYLGAYMAILTPQVANADLWYLFVLFVVAVLLTSSRGAFLALFAGLLMIWPMSVLIIAVSFLVIYMIAWDHIPTSSLHQSMGRLKVWMLSLIQIRQFPNWLIGRGFGTFAGSAIANTLRYSDKESFVHVHNDWLQFLNEYGAVGVAALVLFLAPLVPHMQFGNPMAASAVAIATISCLTFIHHIGPIAVTSLILIGLLSRGVM